MAGASRPSSEARRLSYDPPVISAPILSVDISNLLTHVIAIIRLRPIAGISRATVAIDSSTWPLKA